MPPTILDAVSTVCDSHRGNSFLDSILLVTWRLQQAAATRHGDSGLRLQFLGPVTFTGLIGFLKVINALVGQKRGVKLVSGAYFASDLLFAGC
jgi:hypothetical protein